jgi:hypothetical protein
MEKIEIDQMSLQRAKTLAQLHKLTLPELQVMTEKARDFRRWDESDCPFRGSEN